MGGRAIQKAWPDGQVQRPGGGGCLPYLRKSREARVPEAERQRVQVAGSEVGKVKTGQTL